MANHIVKMSLPDVVLSSKDAQIDIFKNGSKWGTILISQGSIEWYPKNAKQGYSLSWSKFDKIIKASFEKNGL